MPSAVRTFHIRAFDARTLSWWRSQRSKIDFDPPYQRRGHLWSKADKAYLVDSILNGYDIPKLYIADFTWGKSRLNEKRLPYAIIDGKQRFEAILDFFDGKVVLNEDFVSVDNPELQLGGLGYSDLKNNYADVAEIFDNFNLSVMAVYAQDEEPISELFVRLNRSKSLTGAEVRNAMSGPAPKVIREIAKHEFFSSSISFTVQRGQDQNAAAKILMFEYSNELNETKKRNLDAFVKEAQKATNKQKLELAGRRVREILDDMASIFLPKDRILTSNGVMPVYYWFVRSRKQDDYPYVREFLVRFEQARKENRQLESIDPTHQKLDRKLLEFDQFNRSTNDLQSHVGRWEILESEFKKVRPKLMEQQSLYKTT